MVDPIGSFSTNGVHHPLRHFLVGDRGLNLLEVTQFELGRCALAHGR